MSNKVIIFSTQQAAQDVLDAIHALAAPYLEAQGATVRPDSGSPSGIVVVDKRGDGSDSPSDALIANLKRRSYVTA